MRSFCRTRVYFAEVSCEAAVANHSSTKSVRIGGVERKATCRSMGKSSEKVVAGDAGDAFVELFFALEMMQVMLEMLYW